jgi:hypothetical protein
MTAEARFSRNKRFRIAGMVGGSTFLAIGLMVALIPYHRSLTIRVPGEVVQMSSVSIRCRSSVLGAFGEDSVGWIGYAPNTSITDSPAADADCPTSARRRLALATSCLAMSIGAIAVAARAEHDEPDLRQAAGDGKRD